MRHEHLVQVNDPATPALPPVSRRQLWRALVLRAEDPRVYMLALDGCKIKSRVALPHDRLTLHRQLDFGNFVVQDRATLAPPDLLVIDTEAGSTWPASRLTICVEEPAPGSLLLRFVYESGESVDAGLDAMTGNLRRQAYDAADIDMVACIRQRVEDGALGE